MLGLTTERLIRNKAPFPKNDGIEGQKIKERKATRKCLQSWIARKSPKFTPRGVSYLDVYKVTLSGRWRRQTTKTVTTTVSGSTFLDLHPRFEETQYLERVTMFVFLQFRKAKARRRDSIARTCTALAQKQTLGVLVYFTWISCARFPPSSLEGIGRWRNGTPNMSATVLRSSANYATAGAQGTVVVFTLTYRHNLVRGHSLQP